MEPQKTPFGQNPNPNNDNPDSEPPVSASGADNSENVAEGSPSSDSAAPTPSETDTPASQASQDASEAPEVPMAGATFKPGASTPTGGPSSWATADPTVPSAASSDQAPLPVLPSEESTNPVVPGDALPVAPPKHRKKGLVIGLIIAAVLVFLLGGAAAAYYYVANKPENVLKKALANSFDLEKAKTMQFNGEVRLDGEGMSGGLTFKGTADNKTGAFDVSSDVDAVVTRVTLQALSPDGKNFYVKAGGLEGLPALLAATGEMGAAYAPMITSINDQWIEINESFLKQLGDSYEAKTLTEADFKKITTAYSQHPFFVVTETLKDEEIAGQKSHHYKVIVDRTKLKSFAVALKDAKLDAFKIEQKDIDELDAELPKDLDKYPVEVWVSKKSKMITQVAFKTTQEGTTINLRFTVESYNKPVKVEKPETSKSLLEVMGDFMGGGSLSQGLGLPATEELQSGISL